MTSRMAAPTMANGNEATTQVIELPPLRLGKLSLTVVGDSPLICNAWSEKAKQQMLDKQMKKARAKKDAKDPWTAFLDTLYWLTPRPNREVTADDLLDAKFGFPSVAFKKAAIDACSHVEGVTKVLARGAFHVLGEFVQVDGGVPTMREDTVRVGMGAADIHYRATFTDWRVRLTVQYNTRILSISEITNLFNTAGFAIGVGEWRPQRSGLFGMFHVALEGE